MIDYTWLVPDSCQWCAGQLQALKLAYDFAPTRGILAIQRYRCLRCSRTYIIAQTEPEAGSTAHLHEECVE